MGEFFKVTERRHLSETSWVFLRNYVDPKIPRGAQIIFYDHLEKQKPLGKLFFRACDYGLLNLYWLLSGKSLRTVPDCISEFFFNSI